MAQGRSGRIHTPSGRKSSTAARLLFEELEARRLLSSSRAAPHAAAHKHTDMAAASEMVSLERPGNAHASVNSHAQGKAHGHAAPLVSELIVQPHSAKEKGKPDEQSSNHSSHLNVAHLPAMTKLSGELSSALAASLQATAKQHPLGGPPGHAVREQAHSVHSSAPSDAFDKLGKGPALGHETSKHGSIESAISSHDSSSMSMYAANSGLPEPIAMPSATAKTTSNGEPANEAVRVHFTASPATWRPTTPSTGNSTQEHASTSESLFPQHVALLPPTIHPSLQAGHSQSASKADTTISEKVTTKEGNFRVDVTATSSAANWRVTQVPTSSGGRADTPLPVVGNGPVLQPLRPQNQPTSASSTRPPSQPTTRSPAPPLTGSATVQFALLGPGPSPVAASAVAQVAARAQNSDAQADSANPEALAAASEQARAEANENQGAVDANVAVEEAGWQAAAVDPAAAASQASLPPGAEPVEAGRQQTLDNQPLPVPNAPLDGRETESLSLSGTAAQSAASAWTTVASYDPGALLAQACDSLVETLPIDLTAVDEALSDLLLELEELGQDLATSLAQVGVSPWFALAAMGAAAGELHRRRRLQRRTDPSLVERDAVFKLFPELLGLVPRGDA